MWDHIFLLKQNASTRFALVFHNETGNAILVSRRIRRKTSENPPKEGIIICYWVLIEAQGMAADNEPRPCSSKELKEYARPIFAADWAKYYPTTVLLKYGFERVKCPHCGSNYWRCSPERKVCSFSESKDNFLTFF